MNKYVAFKDVYMDPREKFVTHPVVSVQETGDWQETRILGYGNYVVAWMNDEGILEAELFNTELHARMLYENLLRLGVADPEVVPVD